MREAAGLTVRALADAIGRDHGHLSRIERGQREASPAIVAAYQAACQGSLDDVRRRAFLAAGAALPAALAMPLGPVRVGAAEVDAIRALALDMELSNPLALHAAEAALQRAAAMLHARVSPAVAPRLAEAVALLADRVGWGQHEAGQDASSTLGYAHRTAQRGDDVDLHAHALLDLAVATLDSRVALATLDHALDGKVQGAERVNLHAVAARRAAVINPRAAREHLARALDIEPTPGTREWSAQITSSRGHLDAIVGFACHAVGHQDAGRRLTAAVAGLEGRRKRTRARCHARLAGLSLVGADPSDARDHLHLALTSRRSVQVTNDLRAFAVTARQVGRPDLARLAERAPHN
jgi:hypothetical protein